MKGFLKMKRIEFPTLELVSRNISANTPGTDNSSNMITLSDRETALKPTIKENNNVSRNNFN
jgi:hypothetical protein